MNVGDRVYLSHEIIEPACEDHPSFLMGVKGEEVEIKAVDDKHKFAYTVEGPTNPGKTWYASRTDLMRTKPFSFN